ncbi:hypothetical protein CEP53_001017 [Fusarium sp. AF-6]|nr:hypothetical protein CEP53_001017 [Fusarium sp. AF-6]
MKVRRGHYPLEIIPKVTPLSDAAGEVISVGSEVINFKKNEKVVTAMNGDFTSGPIKQEIFTRVLGSSIHGVAAEYVVLPENFLLPLPRNLSFIEGSTLCLERPLRDSGSTSQTGRLGPGSGHGRSGAKVVAVTSSAAKAEVLKQLGADHVVNYSESFAALKMDGLVALVGFRSGKPQEQNILTSIGSSFATMRMVYVGPRSQYEEMNRFIEQHNIHPLVDKEVFPFQNLRESFTSLASMKYMGKVCVAVVGS